MLTTFIAQHATAIFIVGYIIFTVGIIAIIIASVDNK